VPQWPAHLHHLSLHSFTFCQLPPACAFSPLAPRFQAAPCLCCASRHSLRVPPPPPPTVVHVPGAPSPTRSALPPPPTRAPGFARPPGTYAAVAAAALFPLSPAAHASAAARGPYPGYPALRRRCRHSRSCINPTTEQTPATATYQAARYVHYSLNCLPSPPYWPRENSRHFFDSSSPPPGTEAYHPSKYRFVSIN
jgi:hypothetical protein